jgi:alkyl sulfatase BDS1-like metallo-beta-lactamase superfamily hydrolase
LGCTARTGGTARCALLADVLERLGFGSENGTWRSAFLSGAAELRGGNFGSPTVASSADLLSQLSPELFFDALAIQVNGPEAWNLDLAVRWEFPDHRATYRTTLHNGVFSYTRDGQGDVALTLKVPRPALGALAAGDVGQAQGAGLTLDGDPAVLKQILGVLQPGDPAFNIIEP